MEWAAGPSPPFFGGEVCWTFLRRLQLPGELTGPQRWEAVDRLPKALHRLGPSHQHRTQHPVGREQPPRPTSWLPSGQQGDPEPQAPARMGQLLLALEAPDRSAGPQPALSLSLLLCEMGK